MQNNNMDTQQNSDFDVEIVEDDISQNIEESNFPLESDSENFESKQSEERENNRFKEGEKLIMIRVRFPGNARSFPFLIGKRKFAYGQKVVAMSDRGMTVGYINSFPYEVTFNKSMLPIRSIAKIATEEDVKAQKEFRASEKKAEVICLRLIEKYKLDMVLTHVEFTQFGKKAVFYFNAPARVDFRDLVKDLVYELKMRIELRQISVRDRAAALGSVGACGLQTCCSSFLKNYGNVSIKMAKNQNLALIPSKLNGVCGQIKCCIKYEDEVYTDKRKHLPREGSFIKAKNGDRGRVQKLNILLEQFEMLTDNGIRRRYAADQYSLKESELSSDYKFPEFFDNIINETQALIGQPRVENNDSAFLNNKSVQETYESNNDVDNDHTEEEIVDVKMMTESNNDQKTSQDRKEQKDVQHNRYKKQHYHKNRHHKQGNRQNQNPNQQNKK